MATIEGVNAALKQRCEDIARHGFYTELSGYARQSSRTVCATCGCVVADTLLHRRVCPHESRAATPPETGDES